MPGPRGEPVGRHGDDPEEFGDEDEEASLVLGRVPAKPVAAEQPSTRLWKAGRCALLFGLLLLAVAVGGHFLPLGGVKAAVEGAAASATAAAAGHPRPLGGHATAAKAAAGAEAAAPDKASLGAAAAEQLAARDDGGPLPPPVSQNGKAWLLPVNDDFDLRNLQAPVSRCVLALGVPKVIVWFEKPRFEVFYVELRNESVLELAWKAGWPGIVWQGVRSLPFNNFAFDILVVGRSWCADGNCTERVVDEWLRVLRPNGKLLIWEADSVLPALASHPLLRVMRFKNLYQRAERNVQKDVLPVCPSCVLGHRNVGRLARGTRWLHQTRCQPLVPALYAAPDTGPRLKELRKKGRAEMARLWYVREENLYLNTTNWIAGAHNRENYLGKMQKGRRHPVAPNGWKRRWFGGPAPHRILDAGAGTCSGSAWMLDEGFLNKRLFFNYGYYDCSMAAVCAERGFPILAWDWDLPLPICSKCKFDMVNQVGGVHHQSYDHCHSVKDELRCAKNSMDRLLKSFDQVLECGGFMFLHDLPSTLPSNTTWLWSDYVLLWGKRKRYVAFDHSTRARGVVRVQKTC